MDDEYAQLKIEVTICWQAVPKRRRSGSETEREGKGEEKRRPSIHVSSTPIYSVALLKHTEQKITLNANSSVQHCSFAVNL